jgi:hypothetical protein
MTVVTRGALDALLRTPDPPEMLGVWGQRRGNTITRGGKHILNDTIKLRLAVAYATWQWHEQRDASSANKAKKIRMRIVRRA